MGNVWRKTMDAHDQMLMVNLHIGNSNNMKGSSEPKPTFMQLWMKDALPMMAKEYRRM